MLPVLVLVVVLAVVLTLAQVIDPVVAFLGAIVASLVLAIVAAIRRGPAPFEVTRLRPRMALGILLWLTAIGVFVWVANAWSDFGSP
jgi:hypothetical protein